MKTSQVLCTEKLVSSTNMILVTDDNSGNDMEAEYLVRKAKRKQLLTGIEPAPNTDTNLLAPPQFQIDSPSSSCAGSV